jgi:lipopolysaccharide export system protein LptA
VRLNIERIRTLVLVAALLLVAALGVFLVRAKWKNVQTRGDVPPQLAKNILEESNGFNYSHNFGAHSKFKIHASKAVELKNDHVELHDVEIELYGEGSNSIDRIAGDTFEYDQKSGLAIAQGPVEMFLTRPAVTQKPAAQGKAGKAENATGQILLKTSGVTFDQDTGLVATAKRVDFTMNQSKGSAVGALYDSQNGYLTLDHAVELKTQRSGVPVAIEAQRAEFDRGAQSCLLQIAKVTYRSGEAEAAQARILFRTDGTAQQLDGTGGFTIQTPSGGHLAAPTAQMTFDEHDQPRHGQLEGGVTMDSVAEGRTMHGSSPTAELEFTPRGLLRRALLERGVKLESEETNSGGPGQSAALRVTRTWRSPIADVNFVDAGNGRLQLESIHGTDGVVITSESRRGDADAVPSKMSADEITGTFWQGSTLRTITGVGHAAIEQTMATGTRQTASGDQLEVQFTPTGAMAASDRSRGTGTNTTRSDSGNESLGAAEIQSAELAGHVALFEQSRPKPGSRPQPPLRATAGKALYQGSGQWIHLTIGPRVAYGGLQMTAEKVDISRQSGDAFAYGNVKGTWTDSTAAVTSGQSANANSEAGPGSMTLGGRGPVHVIAAEAQLNESTGQATFRGRARLWQLANSVSAPEIVLNQHLQTLVARSTNQTDPVRAVLLSAGGLEPGLGAHPATSMFASGSGGSRPATQAVIRVNGGELEYFEAEHRAVMRAGAVGAVVAETGTATSSSNTVDLRLMPSTNPDGSSRGQTQVDRMTATGHVTLTSQGRTGSGEQLVYSSVTGEYVLTGTAEAPPQLTDPTRGTVTGEALIFNSRNDSVSIEGGGRKTITRTTAPEVHMK